jgi:hypothetical protein
LDIYKPDADEDKKINKTAGRVKTVYIETLIDNVCVVASVSREDVTTRTKI